MDWWRTNWGNLASVAGLVIAWVTLWQVRSTRALVRRAFERDDSFRTAIEVVHALTVIEKLQSSSAKRLQHGDCRALRRFLSRIKRLIDLSDEERSYLRSRIAFLEEPVDNSPEAKRWLAELSDVLDDLLQRITKRLREVD